MFFKKKERIRPLNRLSLTTQITLMPLADIIHLSPPKKKETARRYDKPFLYCIWIVGLSVYSGVVGCFACDCYVVRMAFGHAGVGDTGK